MDLSQQNQQFLKVTGKNITALALEIPLKNVSHFSVASSRTGKFGAVLERVVSFPFAQHMLSDAPGIHTHYNTEQELRNAVESADFKNIKTLGR